MTYFNSLGLEHGHPARADPVEGNGPVNAFIRIEGKVEALGRGLVLRLDDGDIWKIAGSESLETWIGLRVIIEGTRKGQMIEPYYIGLTSS